MGGSVGFSEFSERGQGYSFAHLFGDTGLATAVAMAMAMIVVMVMFTMVVLRTGGRLHTNVTWVKGEQGGRDRGKDRGRLI
jgi:hypothetical protein